MKDKKHVVLPTARAGYHNKTSRRFRPSGLTTALRAMEVGDYIWWPISKARGAHAVAKQAGVRIALRGMGNPFKTRIYRIE